MARVTPKRKGWSTPPDVARRTGASLTTVYLWLSEKRPDYPSLESRAYNGIKHVSEGKLKSFCDLWSLTLGSAVKA